MNITKLDYTINQASSNKIQKKQKFWDALQDFRQQFSPEEFDFDEDIFNDVRDRSIGREVFL